MIPQQISTPPPNLIHVPKSLEERLMFNSRTLNPPQQKMFEIIDTKFLHGACRIILLTGGSRLGKTIGACKALMYLILGHPERLRVGRSAIISASLNQADMARLHMDSWFGYKHEPIPGVFTELKTDKSGIRKFYLPSPNPVATRGKPYEIHLRTGRSADAVKGWNYDFIILDEGLLCRAELLEVCIARLTDADGLILISSTPKGYTPMLREILEKKKKRPEMVEIIEGSLYENYFLDQETIRSRAELFNDKLRDQEVHGKVVNIGGDVFKTFSLQRNVRDLQMDEKISLCQKGTVVGGVDIGSNEEHKFAVVWVVELNGQYFVVYEHLEAGCDITRMGEIIQESPIHQYTKWYYCDSEQPNIIWELRNRQGINIYPCVKKDVFTRIITILSLINKGDLVISSDCPETIFQMSAYGYTEKGEVRKTYDDAIDALGYMVTSYIRIVKKEDVEDQMDEKNPDGTYNRKFLAQYRKFNDNSIWNTGTNWIGNIK